MSLGKVLSCMIAAQARPIWKKVLKISNELYQYFNSGPLYFFEAGNGKLKRNFSSGNVVNLWVTASVAITCFES